MKSKEARASESLYTQIDLQIAVTDNILQWIDIKVYLHFNIIFYPFSICGAHNQIISVAFKCSTCKIAPVHSKWLNCDK